MAYIDTSQGGRARVIGNPLVNYDPREKLRPFRTKRRRLTIGRGALTTPVFGAIMPPRRYRKPRHLKGGIDVWMQFVGGSGMNGSLQTVKTSNGRMITSAGRGVM